MNKPSKSMINRKTAGWSSLITFAILLLAWISGFSSRLFAVIRFESIIHEFDPWYLTKIQLMVASMYYWLIRNSTFLPKLFRFNYRATAYMVQHGFYDFLNWFDERAWYPLGRIVGGTVYPGLMITSGGIHWLLHLLNIPVHIRDICVFLAPVFRYVFF